MSIHELIEHMQSNEVLSSPEIVEAFSSISRETFLPEEYKSFAGEDRPLNIGYGQTNSQPSTVAFMLELLQPQTGDTVLDVGAGSGWTTALLAHIVGKKGRVYGVEIVEELVEFGNNNLNMLSVKNASIQLADKEIGLASKAPFDRILVSAAAQNMPQALIDQLAFGGRMVLPIDYSIWSLDKQADGSIDTNEYPGFAFVPLRE